MATRGEYKEGARISFRSISFFSRDERAEGAWLAFVVVAAAVKKRTFVFCLRAARDAL